MERSPSKLFLFCVVIAFVHEVRSLLRSIFQLDCCVIKGNATTEGKTMSIKTIIFSFIANYLFQKGDFTPYCRSILQEKRETRIGVNKTIVSIFNCVSNELLHRCSRESY
mmetsp:Transcript_27708/g.59217  ORF Transcript_27708/g.59217 Transcript_27708/m.59217 type:complete len:110 (+) Transcript_27708:1017-1346(+)